MRADGIGVRTWLLAAIAGWAILVWALAIFGMGSDISPLSADAALAPSLPPAPSASRLASHNMNEYGEATTRPLFFSDRRPKPFSLQPGGDEPTQDEFNYVLSSVLIAPGLQMAILQSPEGGAEPIRLKLGEDSDKLPGWRLTELTPRSATVASATETRSLELRVFDGRNGQPPTAQPSAQRAAGAAQATMPVPPPPNPVPSPPMTPKPQPARTATGDPAPPQPETEQSAAPPASNEAQLQAIRQRIEARRAKLRQEAQDAAKPKN